MTSKFIMKKLLGLYDILSCMKYFEILKSVSACMVLVKFLQTNLECVLICLFFIYVHLIISLILIASVLL